MEGWLIMSHIGGGGGGVRFYASIVWCTNVIIAGFSFEARGWTFRPVDSHSMSSNLMPIFV